MTGTNEQVIDGEGAYASATAPAASYGAGGGVVPTSRSPTCACRRS